MGTWPTGDEAHRRRLRAIELRRQGLSYKRIRCILGGSMSTLSAWLRGIPLTELQRVGLKRRHLDAVRRTARANHEKRLAREAAITRATAAEVGRVSARDLFIAGVVAYAAEGEKRKPWQSSVPVKFINSDPRMIELFIQDAEVDQALRFWSRVVGAPAGQFQRTTLKKGNPKTTRRNRGPEYRGCLVIRVRRSGDLNKHLDGWFDAMVREAIPGGRPRPGSVWKGHGPEILNPPLPGWCNGSTGRLGRSSGGSTPPPGADQGKRTNSKWVPSGIRNSPPHLKP